MLFFMGMLFFMTDLGIGQPLGEKTESPSLRAQDQLNAVLAHCPQLKKIVWQGNPIWTWLTEAFNTSGLGITIVLDTQPVSIEHTDAESGALNSNGIFYVKVNPRYSEGAQAGQERAAEEILCNLVFELNSVKLYHRREIISHLAQCGEISREGYIYDCAQEEYIALKETSDFFNTIWVAFCIKNNIQANPHVWRLPLEATFDEWLAKYPKSSWYPWKIFGSRYDQENRGLIHPEALHVLTAEEIRDLIKKAATGNSQAQERVGIAFLSGEIGISVTNDQQAFDWMLKAANQEDILAQKHLEWMYRVGIGIKEDQSQSFDWNQKAANQGDAQAEFLLGAHYEQGVGVPKNLAEAMRWFQKSADQGYGQAEDKVGSE